MPGPCCHSPPIVFCLITLQLLNSSNWIWNCLASTLLFMQRVFATAENTWNRGKDRLFDQNSSSPLYNFAQSVNHVDLIIKACQKMTHTVCLSVKYDIKVNSFTLKQSNRSTDLDLENLRRLKSSIRQYNSTEQGLAKSNRRIGWYLANLYRPHTNTNTAQIQIQIQLNNK